MVFTRVSYIRSFRWLCPTAMSVTSAEEHGSSWLGLACTRRDECFWWRWSRALCKKWRRLILERPLAAINSLTYTNWFALSLTSAQVLLKDKELLTGDEVNKSPAICGSNHPNLLRSVRYVHVHGRQELFTFFLYVPSCRCHPYTCLGVWSV